MLTSVTAQKHWSHIFDTYSSISALQAATRSSTDELGLRSVRWRLFLLYPDAADIKPASWLPQLRLEREAFEGLCKTHTVREEDLAALDFDPLAEDASNPWEQYRRDQELRQEILQDIERCMPDHSFFRSASVQQRLLQVLFIYCKLNSDISYRQGFHELAAAVFWVVHCDALEHCEDDAGEMEETLSARYTDHDTFTIFQAIMKAAKPWYELGDAGDAGNSPIVKKSRYIHETLLRVTDSELGEHLKALDVLPQVFLIRWVRLLFSREFPFDEMLKVWDHLFAEDKDLHLVDLMCVAMLLRIRWQLIEADYSTALTLVLRYPSPPCPKTFVQDALYLRENLSPDGGRYLIVKYSKRPPRPSAPTTPPRATTPRRNRTNSRRPMSPAWTAPTAQLENMAKNVFDVAVRGVQQLGSPLPPPHPRLRSQSNKSRREQELEREVEQLKARLKLHDTRRQSLAKVLTFNLDIDDDSILERVGHVRQCLLDPDAPINTHLVTEEKVGSPPLSPKPGFPKARVGSVSINGKDAKGVADEEEDLFGRAHKPRESLAQSSFAWMLGEEPAERNRSGFVPRASRKRQDGEVGLEKLNR